MDRKDYNKSAQLAQKRIKKAGSDCVIKRNEGALIDPSKPWLGETNLTVDYTCQGVLLSVTDRDYKQYPALTTITADKKILVDPISLNTTPIVGDKIEQNGVEWLITAVKDLTPAETNVLWTLYVSR